MERCPSDEDIASFVGGALRDDAVRAIEAHIDQCSDCRVVVAMLAGGPILPPPAGLDVGARVGRFVVIGLIGQGGMGAVYAAYDPALDRKVALKLVLPGRGAEPEHHARLMREAQAMARLSHAEVITVYEVGEVGDDVFIAMEFVEGGTLRQWLKEKPRGWREVLDRFTRAGEGLLAAHDVGIVHRDFKAENVLVGASGRQRVTDFGLARATGLEEPSSGPPLSPDSPLGTALTRSGGLLGTPVYMAPEQLMGAAVDARVDQFSFCAALYEALYGELPFDGEGFAAYTGAVLAGKLRPLRRRTGVPTRLREDLVRGLATRPEDRYPSMRELLEALRARTRRRTGATLAGGALALLCAGALAQGLVARPRAEPICSGAEHKLDGLWDGAARQALRSAFAATSRSYAADTGERVVRVLDGYSGAWVSARTDACLATRVRGEQSEKLLDLRVACLDRRLVEMKALIDMVTRSADDDLVNRSVEAASKLTRLDGCSDAQALEALLPPPEDAGVRAQVEAVYRHLDEAKAEYRVAHYKNALELARTAAADPVPYPPVHARALFERARVEDEMGDHNAAERSLLEALPVSAAGRDDRLASEIWSLLVYVVAYPLARANDAQAMLVAGEAALLRAGSPPEAASSWVYSKALVCVGLRRFEEARTLTERALAIDGGIDAMPVVKAGWVASNLDQLANISKTLGKVEAAVDYSTRSIAMREQALGPDHPRIADALNNLSATLLGSGRYAEAAPLLSRALAIDEKTVGTQTLRAARILENIAEVARAEGRYADAEVALRRGLGIREKVLGSDHPNNRWTLANLAGVLRRRGRFDDARAAAARALVVGQRGVDAEHVDAPVPGLVALGEIAYDQGRYADARGYAERALVLADAVQANDPTAPVDPLRDLACASLKLGRPRDALTAGERALAIAAGNPMPPAETASIRFAVAQALRAAGGDRARAVALAERARDAFTAAGGGKARELDETLAWLRVAR